MAGPYYKYRTYYDMIHNECAHSLPTLRPVLTRLKSLPFIAVGFLLVSHYFSIQVGALVLYLQLAAVIISIKEVISLPQECLFVSVCLLRQTLCLNLHEIFRRHNP